MKVNTPILIPVADLHEHADNPNVQDSFVFSNLLNEIATDGFEEAIAVVKNENLGLEFEGYTVVAGNHRLKAARELGIEELPCFVHEWDAETCKIKLVRRNMLKGDLDPKKFTRLVESLDSTHTPEELADMMGFKDEEFERLYQKEAEDVVSNGKNFAPKEDSLIDGATIMLNRIFSESGDSVHLSFLCFTHNGQVHTMIQMNDKLPGVLSKITDYCKSNNLDINSVLYQILGSEIDNLDDIFSSII